MAVRVTTFAVLLTALMAIAPSGASAYINAGFKSESEAREYYRRQRDERASQAAAELGVLNAAITRDPEDAVAYYQRAKFHTEFFHLNQRLALADFDAAIRLKPDFTKALSRRAAVLAAMRDYARSAADLTEALRQDSKAANIKLRLATLYYASPDESVRDLVKSRQLAEELVASAEKPIAAHLDLLAATCAELGDFDSAVKWETKRLQGEPASVAAQSGRIESYKRSEFAADLRSRLAGSLAHDPTN